MVCSSPVSNSIFSPPFLSHLGSSKKRVTYSAKIGSVTTGMHDWQGKKKALKRRLTREKPWRAGRKKRSRDSRVLQRFL